MMIINDRTGFRSAARRTRATARGALAGAAVLGLLVLAGGGPGTALAAEPTPGTPDQACTAARQACEADCARLHTPGSAGHDGCATRCLAEEKTCEAAAGLRAAQPWIEDQVDRLQNFLDGFVGSETPGRPDAPKAPAPPTPPKAPGDRNQPTDKPITI